MQHCVVPMQSLAKHANICERQLRLPLPARGRRHSSLRQTSVEDRHVELHCDPACRQIRTVRRNSTRAVVTNDLERRKVELKPGIVPGWKPSATRFSVRLAWYATPEMLGSSGARDCCCWPRASLRRSCAKCCEVVVDCEFDCFFITQRGRLSGRDPRGAGNFLCPQRSSTDKHNSYSNQ